MSKPPKRSTHLADHAIDLSRVAEIRDDADRVAARTANLDDYLLDGVPHAIDHRNAGTLVREQARGGSTDPARSARDTGGETGNRAAETAELGHAPDYPVPRAGATSSALGEDARTFSRRRLD